MNQRSLILDKLLSGERMKKVIDKIQEGSVVLDVGCGKNARLLNRVSGKIYLGVGIDPKSEGLNNKNVFLMKKTFKRDLFFEEKTFDCIVSLALLEHLNNPFDFLKETYRCLKPNGTLLLTTPAPQSHLILELLAKVGLLDLESINDHKRYYTKIFLKEQLEEAGFRKVEVSSFQFGFNFFVEAVK